MNTYYLYLIGQANSLVINQMLKFALYMYILDNTGSSVIYSNIIAFSMLPIIFFSPIAGWICDYVKKKKLIVMLDVTSGIILSLFFLLSNKVIAICIILFILGILGMLETPATQAAVPLITDDLNKTNTEIAQISSISAILAPILGGVIYNTFSINKIIIFSIIGFGITAFLESLIKMKNEQCIRDSAILGIKQGIKYLFVEEKEILKLVLYAGVISCEITGLLTIAFPYIIRNTLQYSTTVYGYAEGSLGIVAIGATFYYSFTRRKWGSNKTNNLVIGIGGCVMITGIILWICQTRNAIFITILVLCSIIQFNINIFSDSINSEKYRLNISPRNNIINIKSKCIEFVNNFDNPDTKNLLFTGNTGLGKTFMSNCIANELIKKGKNVLYQTAPVLLETVIDNKMNKYKNSKQDNFYKNVLEADLLIIDDLGTECLNSMKLSELFTILNTRLLNLNNKVTKTIISTNLGINNIFRNYEERIGSRIAGFYDIYYFFGDDLRLSTKH